MHKPMTGRVRAPEKQKPKRLHHQLQGATHQQSALGLSRAESPKCLWQNLFLKHLHDRDQPEESQLSLFATVPSMFCRHSPQLRGFKVTSILCFAPWSPASVTTPLSHLCAHLCLVHLRPCTGGGAVGARLVWLYSLCHVFCANKQSNVCVLCSNF